MLQTAKNTLFVWVVAIEMEKSVVRVRPVAQREYFMQVFSFVFLR